MIESNTKNFLIVGLGNVFRGDDSIGILVARFLRRIFPENVRIIGIDLTFEDLIQSWEKFDVVILIDAVRSEDEIGKVYRFDLSNIEIPAKLEFYSTHALGISEYIKIAGALGTFPKRVVVYGIVGKRFGMGDQISQAVKSSAKMVIKQILRDCGVE